MNLQDYKSEHPDDKFYKWKGVKPPERNPHLTETELREILSDNLTGHVCEWQQEGATIFCEAGDFTHGKHIGPHKRLAGTQDGKPILVAVGPIYRKDVVY